MRFAQVTPEGEYKPPPPENAKAAYATMVYVRATIVEDAGWVLARAATIAVSRSVCEMGNLHGMCRLPGWGPSLWLAQAAVAVSASALASIMSVLNRVHVSGERPLVLQRSSCKPLPGMFAAVVHLCLGSDSHKQPSTMFS